jgi:hypothetical protein
MAEELNSRLLTKEEIFECYKEPCFPWPYAVEKAIAKAQDAKTLSILNPQINTAISKLHEAEKCLGEIADSKRFPMQWKRETEQFIQDAIRILEK